ncbi:MAG TPA: MYXO-CTERM sorting domain-containing protein, partial [Polyangia bacterium]
MSCRHRKEIDNLSNLWTGHQSTSGGGPVDLPDSGAAVPQGQDFAKASGCSCALTSPSRDASLLVFALAGFVAVVVRRSR